jgi:hypothetical protein
MLASLFARASLVAVLPALLAVGCAKPCPEKLSGDVPSSCACAGSATGPVWGSGIYTTDSNVCAAAQHAGAIGPGGGTAKPRSAAGCPAYVGSAANGVTTSSWGSYQGSFFFDGHGDGKCPPAPPPPPPAAAPAGVAPGGECPATINRFEGYATAQEFACTCPATSGGSIYGTGVYTTDSSLCAAAVHAGAAPPTGGPVKAIKAAGCSKYVTTSANGITSSSWGAYESSFYFAGHGDGRCPG